MLSNKKLPPSNSSLGQFTPGSSFGSRGQALDPRRAQGSDWQGPSPPVWDSLLALGLTSNPGWLEWQAGGVKE